MNNCPCATCVVTSGICQNCGNKPGSDIRHSPSHMVSLVPETSEGLLPENYGPFLLKNPHRALWDHKTRVVEIDKGSSTEFPFSCKVKIGKVHKKIGIGQEGSAGSGIESGGQLIGSSTEFPFSNKVKV